MLGVYPFCPRRGLALCAEEIAEILAAASSGSTVVEVSVGIGTGKAALRSSGGLVELGGVTVDAGKLASAAREGGEDDVFFLTEGGEVVKVAFFRGHLYYKLEGLGRGVAPTLEISGIRMHNIVGTDPWRDARRKVELVGVGPGDVVLDVCTGLGYTASHAVARGAEVVTVEKDVAVLEVAEYNPWSRLLAHPSVTILLGDALEVLEELPEGCFDAAVHDPPTFRIAGELYGLEFYRRLRRVLRRGARVFHYTGWPGKHRGLDIQRGVARRMRAAGFRVLRAIRGYGILAEAV